MHGEDKDDVDCIKLAQDKNQSSDFCDKGYFLKPSGYVIHQQFNTQQLYVLPTLYFYVLYLSENKQRLVPLTA